MGYTHYWAYLPTHPDYATAWPTILADTHRIIEWAHRAGIVIAGPNGRGRPVLDRERGIEFNGAATRDLDCDSFQLLAPLPAVRGGEPLAAAFCKTWREPYDRVVAATMLRCHLLLPESFFIASDGQWNREWSHGALAFDAAQPQEVGARTLVGDLFGAVTTGDPLRTELPGATYRAGTSTRGDDPNDDSQDGQGGAVDAVVL